MTARADVAIVGYGPVGQVLAILLGQHGRRVEVFERWPEPYPLPRAVHFDHEVARILQSAGVGEALAPYTEPASRYEWRNAAGDLLLSIGRDAGAGLSGWPESTMFSQPDLERVLDARAGALPSVRVARGAEVVGVRQDGLGAELTVRGADGSLRTAQARYVVGCDGANSFVRGALAASWTDLGFAFDWLVVDLVPSEPRRWDPMNWQLCDPARPTTLVSGGPGRRRFEFMRLPGESLQALGAAETAWRLLAPFGLTAENATLERHALYTFRGAWADPWRNGRLLLAGDAAHLMPPFAGQGMCAGLRDAANLAWKLDLVLDGRAPESLLDSYPSERLAHVRTAIDFSISLGRVICVADPEEAKARDERMIGEERARTAPLALGAPGMTTGLLGAGGGPLFVQDRVALAGRSGLFDDVVGRGFVLVSPHGDPSRELDAELAAWFASVGGRTAHVGADAPVQDANGSYQRWFRGAGAAVALQRPDFYVFGTAADLAGTAELVRTLRAKLAG
ncbi:MAG TPA: bifunctional 3-(3-hydroxy-phenyl)propionate/3-hydroxycinnamic acid hydroxylase [Myxococcota bacterium]|nr:bifunctional 3-(3-hydroxy-phenyl)propionate/3-hydroxycinnamic acid hydroxylase [Myxococcota bacterium]